MLRKDDGERRSIDMKRRYFICKICNYRYSNFVNMIECMIIHKKGNVGRVYN